LPDIAAYPANQDADALQKAVSGKFQINFKYAVTSSHKDIKPYKLVQYGGFWYLLAVMGKEKILKFRIDEIRNVEITKKTFTPNSKVIKALKESVNIFFELKPDADIKLLVQKEAAKYFKNKKYVPYQKIEKENSDGSLIVASKISKIQEIEPAIFNFMPFVKIVSPEKLSSILKTKISNYLSQI
jgi:predicted DNA-binding transcriptional regulator YafY